jgi:hypothetical protein
MMVLISCFAGGCLPRWTLISALLAVPVTAQTPVVAVPSLFVIPNEGRNPLGAVEGLEGGAYVARAKGVGAICYNPAGVALSKKSEISSSSSAYEWTFYSGQVGGETDTSSRLSSNGRLFGFVLGDPILTNERLRIGFAVPVPVSWKTTLQMDGAPPSGPGDMGALYSTDGTYGDIVPTLALGYSVRPDLRIGASLGLSFLTLKQQQLFRVQSSTPGGSTLMENSFSANGTAYSLLLVGGLQWDVSPAVTLGLALGAPGHRFAGSSNVIILENVSANSGYQTTLFHDPKAEFQVCHPAWLNLGGAWRLGRGAIELNVKTFGAVSSYNLFKSSLQGSVVQAGPDGTTTTVATFGASPDQRRTTTNVTLGGHYDVNERTSWHAGFFTANSPVEAGSTFEQIDIRGLASGCSLRWSNLSGSIGLVYEWGGRSLKVPQTGDPIAVNGGLGIHSFHLLWGLTYVF